MHWKGTKVVTSGIICDNPKLLAAFEEKMLPSLPMTLPMRAVPSTQTFRRMRNVR